MKNHPKINVIKLLFILLFAATNLTAQENPKDAEARRLINEATLSLKDKKFDEVIEKTTKVLEIFPKSGDVYVIRAMAYQEKSEKEKAIEDYSRGLASNISPALEISAHQMRGFLLYSSKKYDEAIKDLDFVISKNPTDFRAYGFRGWCHFYKKNYPEAIADFTGLLKLSPKEIHIRQFRAMAYYYLEDYEKSVQDITEEIKINETPGKETYRIRANAYRRLGKNDLAEPDEKKYLELGGKLSELAIEKSVSISIGAAIYDAPRVKSIQQSIYRSINEKNFDGAFKEVDDLIKNVPSEENTNIKSLIFTARAVNYFKQGEFQKALDDLNEALKLNPKSYMAYQGRAATYRKLGKTADAEADQAKFEELKPKEK